MKNKTIRRKTMIFGIFLFIIIGTIIIGIYQVLENSKCNYKRDIKDYNKKGYTFIIDNIEYNELDNKYIEHINDYISIIDEKNKTIILQKK